jgi:hypothetical protein
MTHEYFVKIWHDATPRRPTALWRRSGDHWEYLSLADWAWHPLDDEEILPHPQTMQPVSADEAAALQADRQRFARYWLLPPDPEFPDRPTLVYRQLASPDRIIEEVFGRDNRWTPTKSIAELQAAGPHERLDLVPSDQETAERVIQRERGITGATEL